MQTGFLKRWMPQGIYGRAALILILPVVTLQLVVSIVFIQRHFEDVTTQMTRNVLAETRYVLREIDAADDLRAAQAVADSLASQLGLAVFLPAPLREVDQRAFYDLSGRVVIRTLRARLPGVTGVDLLTNLREVHVSVGSRHGGVEVRLPRSRLIAAPRKAAGKR